LRSSTHRFLLGLSGLWPLIGLAVGLGSPLHAQPIWDDCSTPILIVNFPSVIPYNTQNATPTPSLPACPNMGGDLWYKVVAPFDGLLEVRHDFNPTQHAVYELPSGSGCPTDLDQLYCDSPSNQNESYTAAVAGMTYLVRLSGYQGGNVSGNLTIDILPPPPNDYCQFPQPLNLPDVVLYDSTGASPTPGLACPVNRDIWFATTPAVDGLVSVDANPNSQASAFGVDVAVYERPFPGACPTDAELVACPGSDSLSFAAVGGTTYLVRIGYPYGDGFASALLSIDQSFGPPPHDDCAGALPLPIPSTTAYDTTGATPDATGLSCDLNDDLWYGFVAPGTGQVRVSFGPGDSVHEVFRLPAGAGTCPTDLDRIGACWSVDESWSAVVAGESYAIRIGQSQTGPTSGFVQLAFIPALANDDCAAPSVLTIPSASAVTTVGSSPDTTGLGCSLNSDSWYRWSIPTTGLLHLEFSDYVEFALYQDPGSCPTDAEQIFCDDGFEALLPVVAGQSLLLRLSTFNAFPPIATDLLLEILQPAVNDDCAGSGALPIACPTPSPVAWDNLTATDDANGLSCSVGRDLWYAFSAPSDGCVEFSSDVDGRYALYLAPAGPPGCPTGPELECFIPALGQVDRFEFPVTAGQGYLLRVGGSSFQTTSGSFSLEYILCAPTGVVCDSSVPGQVTGAFVIPAGTTYDLGVEVRVDGAFRTTLAPGLNSFTESLPPGFSGVLQFGFTGRSGSLGSSEESRCAAAVGAVVNDDCADALPAIVGSNPLDNSISVIDPGIPISGCDSYWQVPTSDIWFEFDVPVTQLYTVSACTAPFASRIELLDGSAGCPSGPASLIECSYGCSISTFLVAGNTVLIRVIGLDASTAVGTLDIAADCPQVTGFACDYDCTTGDLTFTWDGGLHSSYELGTALGPFATGLTGNSYVLAGAPPGGQSYSLTGFCPNGSSTTALCTAFVVDLSAPSPHLVIDLDGIAGPALPLAIDSGEAIATALQGLGESVSVLALPQFDQFPCLGTLTAAAQTIWVTLGTGPERYLLSEAEGDLLAGLAAQGRDIYLEGADHWGFIHSDSLLDLRDGVEPNLFGNIDDGDDSLTALAGFDSGLGGGDFTGIGTVPYIQPDPLGNDRNDRLVVTGTDTSGAIPPDPDITAGAIIRNVDDSMTGEPDYIVAIAAEHADGGRMISSSFEFGGFGGDPGALIEAYLEFFDHGPPLPRFRRGDTNGDELVNIADAIYLLGHLFPLGPQNPIACLDAADANVDGAVNIADVVQTLNVLFGTPAATMPMPYPGCGTSADAPVQTGIRCAVSICP